MSYGTEPRPYHFDKGSVQDMISRSGQFATKDANGNFAFGDYENFGHHDSARFLGLPPRPEILSTASRAERTYDLPKAFEGQSIFLGSQIYGITEADTVTEGSFLFSENYGLPIFHSEVQNLHWNVWYFDESIMDLVPEQGTSRLARASQEAGSTSVTRRGQKIYIEHGFWLTPEGIQHFHRQMMQLQRSFRRTLELSALLAIVSARGDEFEYEQRHGRYRDIDWTAFATEQADRYAVAQKGSLALLQAVYEAQNTIKSRGGVPNCIYACHGGEVFLHGTGKQQTDYYLAGPAGPARAHKNPANVDTFAGLPLFFTKPYSEAGLSTPVDPFFRMRLFGEFAVMKGIRPEKIKASEYQTWHRDIRLYSIKEDDLVTKTLRDSIMNLQGWIPAGRDGHTWLKGMQGPISLEIMESGARPQPLQPEKPADMGDMFGYYNESDEYVFCRRFGEVMRDVLPFELFLKMGECVLNKFPSYADEVQKVNANEIYALAKNEELLLQGMPDNVAAKRKLRNFKAKYDAFRNIFPDGKISPVYTSKWFDIEDWENWINDLQVENDVESPTLKSLFGIGKSCNEIVDAIKEYIRFVDGMLNETEIAIIDQLIAILQNDKLLKRLTATAPPGLIGSSSQISGASVPTAEELTKMHAQNSLSAESHGIATYAQVSAAVSKLHPEQVGPFVSKVSDRFKTGDGNLPQLKKTLFVPLQELQDHASASQSRETKANFQKSLLEFVNSSGTSIPTTTPAKLNTSLLGNAVLISGSSAPQASAGRLTILGRNSENTPKMVIGSRYDYDTNEWAYRRDEILRKTNGDLQKVLLRLMYLVLTRESFLWLCDNDILFPFGFILARPSIRTMTASIIVLQGGAALGGTCMGKKDIMIDDDASNKTHSVHFTATSASFVKNPRLLRFIDDAWNVDVLGGFNADFMTPEYIADFQGSGFQAHRMPSGAPSIFPILTLYRDDKLPHMIDIRGSYGSSEVNANRRHFITTKACLEVFNFDLSAGVVHPYSFNDTQTNTVCFQMHQLGYNPEDKKLNRVTLGRGHIGKNVAAGIRKVLTLSGDNCLFPDCSEYTRQTGDD